MDIRLRRFLQYFLIVDGISFLIGWFVFHQKAPTVPSTSVSGAVSELTGELSGVQQEVKDILNAIKE